jgi:hypothetical protein
MKFDPIKPRPPVTNQRIGRAFRGPAAAYMRLAAGGLAAVERVLNKI